MLKKKPYFTLRVESNGARFDARLNGFSVQKNYKGGSLITELPVNQVFLNGKNVISLLLFATEPNGEFGGTEISASLFVQSKGEPESTKKLVGQVAYSASEKKLGGTGISLSMPAMQLSSKDEFERSDNGDVKIENAVLRLAKMGGGAKEVYQEVYLDTEFPQWKYLNAETLDFPDNRKDFIDNIDMYRKNLIAPLYEFNQNIFELFKNKEIDKILLLMAERNTEMDAALYLPEGSYEEMVRKELESDFKTKKAVINPIDKAFPSISDDKKLIHIGLEGMIYLTDKENSVYSYYDMWFYRKDGKWHISR